MIGNLLSSRWRPLFIPPGLYHSFSKPTGGLDVVLEEGFVIRQETKKPAS